MHEDALAAVQLRASHVYGSFDSSSDYAGTATGNSEQGFEQSLIGAIRVPYVPRAQVALQCPFLQTRRQSRDATDFGGGLGDLNVAARYDLTLAGDSAVVPGIGILVGSTFPTGRPPDRASPPLVADATGIGAVQLTAGLALEQTYGPWLVSAYGFAAKRLPRTINGSESNLATEWTALAAAAYSFDGGYAVALSTTLTFEANASLDDRDVPLSSRRRTVFALVGVLPVSDHIRFQGGPSFMLPISGLGENVLATVSVNATGIYAWY